MTNDRKPELLLKYIFSKNAKYFKNKIIKNNPIFDDNRPVIIFGAAKMGRVFVDACRKNKIIILAYCDNDPKKLNTIKDGLPIINPKILIENYSKDIQIIIATESDKIILSQLKRLNFKRIWSYSYFFSLHSKKFFAFAHSSDFDEIFQNKDNIISAMNLLNDDISKITFVNLLLFRLTLNVKYLLGIQKSSKNIYFDKNIYSLSKNEILIDGGAFDGDTLRMFIRKSNGNFNHVYCFEPDSISFDNLTKYAKRYIDNDQITCLKVGLGEKSKQVQFTNEGNLQSSINNMGELSVQIIPIDKYLNNRISIIKLDIEGYEKQALLGAKKTLLNNKPKLAICSYHFQNDLWNIPLLISKLNRKYKIYLRHYSPHIYETICYGV